MKWFKLSSIYLTFPFLMAIFLGGRVIFLFEVENQKTIEWKHQAFFLMGLMFVSEIIIGLFYFCFQNKRKTFRMNKENKYLVLQDYKVDTIKISKQKKDIITSLLLLLASILDGFGIPGLLYVETFMKEASQTSFALKSLQIISTGLLCYLTLKFFIYRHQYVGMALVIIGIALVTWNHITTEITSVEHILSLITLIILASCQETLDRYIMDEMEIHPLLLLFAEGIFGTVLSILIIGILSYIDCPFTEKENAICDINSSMEDLPALFKAMALIDIAFVIVWTICSSFFNMFSRYSNYYLTPTHRTIADTLSTFALWCYMRISNYANIEEGWYYLSTIIGYILLLFGCLLYNEVIILKICKLDYNTRKEISRRAKVNLNVYIEVEDIFNKSNSIE